MHDVRGLGPEQDGVYPLSPLELMWWSRRVSKRPPPEYVADARFEALTRDCDPVPAPVA